MAVNRPIKSRQVNKRTTIMSYGRSAKIKQVKVTAKGKGGSGGSGG